MDPVIQAALTFLNIIILWLVYVALAYKAGAFGDDTGKPAMFNQIKVVLIFLVAFVYGCYQASLGIVPTLDMVMQWITGFALWGFGLIAIIDQLTTIIIGQFFPTSSLGKPVRMRAPGA
jgi:uncharacterized membrane protein